MKTHLLFVVFIVIQIIILSCEKDHEKEFIEMGTVLLNVKLKLKVGNTLYQDTNATISISGYDRWNTIVWSREFTYSGPYANQFTVKAGFHHYALEVRKFGIVDRKTISAQEVMEGRADGPSPAVFELGGSIDAKRPSYSITYLEETDEEHPGTTVMVPETKVVYHYDPLKKVDLITYWHYSSLAGTFDLDHYSTFSYDGERVDKILNYAADDSLVKQEYYYQYQENGKVSRIISHNKAARVDAEASFTYSATDSTVKANFAASNGADYQYNFLHFWSNIVADKVTRWGRTCNEGSYEHDKNINPLKHLGYLDFTLSNYSINNVMTEAIHYFECSLPDLIPESYTYEYDDTGYPIVANTKYKEPNTQKRQTRYFYIE